MIAMSDEVETLETTCCIAGGGPAGMVLGFLLARAGVDVVVLEKHGDFLRDFRGDTIHPSTLEVMHELGLLDEFLKRPHQEATRISGVIGDVEVPVADFSHLPTRCQFIAFMPQWDFLDFIAEHARRYPTFHLRMQAEVKELVEESGDIVGVRATTPQGPLEVRARLTVGADGRHSTVRERAGLEVEDSAPPSTCSGCDFPGNRRTPTSPWADSTAARSSSCSFAATTGSAAMSSPRAASTSCVERASSRSARTSRRSRPSCTDRVGELKDWDDIKLLTVTVDRLKTWHRPGLLCIGDAAHAMSPIGGVGINLAIQDAVATANILAGPLT